jgi:mannitol-1-phosphate/altronate dehydrogenase
VVAAWARYLAVVDEADQAFDADGDRARQYARDAVADPAAFLGFDAVFPPEVQASQRFRAEFVAAYRRIADSGPIAAMAPIAGGGRPDAML